MSSGCAGVLCSESKDSESLELTCDRGCTNAVFRWGDGVLDGRFVSKAGPASFKGLSGDVTTKEGDVEEPSSRVGASFAGGTVGAVSSMGDE